MDSNWIDAVVLNASTLLASPLGILAAYSGKPVLAAMLAVLAPVSMIAAHILRFHNPTQET